MATNFPTSLDSYSVKASGDTISEAHINNMQDAIVAIETKLGPNDVSPVGADHVRDIEFKVNYFFVEDVRKIWFYEDTAPTGWTYQSGPADRVIGTKGGATYATGGANAGTWTTTHNHRWYIYVANTMLDDQSYNSAGSAIDIDASAQKYAGTSNGIQTVGSASATHPASDYWTSNQYVNESSTWRPAAAVGLIAMYTG